jgi:FKBP-type peptidyl-prolyl cis-trans isomerase
MKSTYAACAALGILFTSPLRLTAAEAAAATSPTAAPTGMSAGSPTPVPPPADVAGPPADAERSASGLAWKVLVPGQGDVRPGQTAKVKVHYTGWTTDGAMFDSSVARGKPVLLPLDKVIPGWREGVALMVPGETRRFWIPEAIAYAGREGAPAGMLVFDIELLEVVQAAPTPEDVAAPPADAQVTESGLAWKLLRAGTGTVHPDGNSLVEVHYTGWTVDGQKFDSSHERGTPARFPVDKVIPGWTEGLQLMVEGESRRFWIPKKLAYRGAPGMPEGMLVFDVDLIRIVRQ